MNKTEKMTRQMREFEHVMTREESFKTRQMCDITVGCFKTQKTCSNSKKEKAKCVNDCQENRVSNFSGVSDLGELPIK